MRLSLSCHPQLSVIAQQRMPKSWVGKVQKRLLLQSKRPTRLTSWKPVSKIAFPFVSSSAAAKKCSDLSGGELACLGPMAPRQAKKELLPMIAGARCLTDMSSGRSLYQRRPERYARE